MRAGILDGFQTIIPTAAAVLSDVNIKGWNLGKETF